MMGGNAMVSDVVGAGLAGMGALNSQTVSFGTQLKNLILARLNAQGQRIQLSNMELNALDQLARRADDPALQATLRKN